ncbi:hypothetical protein [Trichormus azollae]|uniref:hypothetical protein n=1 Tax=Trichormus azollae TaxID=1164 RepID=UPI00325FDB98
MTAKQKDAPMSVSLRDTTQNLSHEQLSKLADSVGEKRTLLVLCSAFRGKADIFPSLTIRKFLNKYFHGVNGDTTITASI